jgi:hypothetical protein
MRIRSKWRVRATQLALTLAGTALMTAIAAAAIGGKAGPASGDAMTAAIVAQQVASGVAPKGFAAPPDESLTREQILTEAATIEVKMSAALDHTEQLRVAARKARDLIRLSVITLKQGDMKQIMAIARPIFASIRNPGLDLFVMRAKLSTLRQGLEAMKQAEADAENAEGGDLMLVEGLFPLPADTGQDRGEPDPTLPPNPTIDNPTPERPQSASPDR